MAIKTENLTETLQQHVDEHMPRDSNCKPRSSQAASESLHLRGRKCMSRWERTPSSSRRALPRAPRRRSDCEAVFSAFRWFCHICHVARYWKARSACLPSAAATTLPTRRVYRLASLSGRGSRITHHAAVHPCNISGRGGFLSAQIPLRMAAVHVSLLLCLASQSVARCTEQSGLMSHNPICRQGGATFSEHSIRDSCTNQHHKRKVCSSACPNEELRNTLLTAHLFKTVVQNFELGNSSRSRSGGS